MNPFWSEVAASDAPVFVINDMATDESTGTAAAVVNATVVTVPAVDPAYATTCTCACVYVRRGGRRGRAGIWACVAERVA